METNKKKEKIIVILGVIIVILIGGLIGKMLDKKEEEKKPTPAGITGNFNVDIIKNTYIKDNYLISPYNIEIALNMLREGADGKTKEEIDKVIGNREINVVSIKDKLNIANAIFIKDEYKNDVKKDFISILDSKYKSELLYDKFEKPDVINNWVKEKTNGMIDKILDRMNVDYVMGLASALALDLDWNSSFECNNTREEDFVKDDNSKMKIEMMHQTYKYNAKYLKNDEVEGIILPYDTEDDTKEIEFVALLPKNGVDNYISNLTADKLNNLFNNVTLASNQMHINLSLPRFTYNYEVNDFINVLKNMGIKEAFDKVLADFTKMIVIDQNVYVGEAIHKTKIELNEKGTKAAAVTYFGMYKATGMIEKDYEEINIKFNKPFIYMIREKNTGEILFFGTVFEPNEWKGTTCSYE